MGNGIDVFDIPQVSPYGFPATDPTYNGISWFDDFSAGAIDTAKWTVSPSVDMSITQTAGELRFAADSSYSTVANQAFVRSVNNFNFSGKEVVLEHVSPATMIGQSGLSPAGATYLIIRDQNNATNYIWARFEGDNAVLEVSNLGSGTLGQIIAAPTTATLWKLVHNTNGIWEWWANQGGAGYTRVAAVRGNWTPNNIKIELGTLISGANQQNVTTRFAGITSTAVPY